MTDQDPLAHLYAETGSGPAGEELPVRETSLEELIAETGGPDEISDSDVDELALLVLARIDAGTLTDDESVELGLGTIGDDGELEPNNVGRRVVARAIWLRFGMTWEQAAERIKELAEAFRGLDEGTGR